LDWLIIACGVILILLGIAGCFLPVLPGPPLSYLAVLLLQLKSDPPFSTTFLITWGILAGAVTLLDYVIPVYGTKRFGGSRYGIMGSIIGLLLGIFFFPPFGIIIGPLIGALLGELYAGQKGKNAMRSAIGSFAGFLFGTFLKLIVSLVLTFYFFVNAF
jgi:hypothetical protein